MLDVWSGTSRGELGCFAQGLRVRDGATGWPGSRFASCTAEPGKGGSRGLGCLARAVRARPSLGAPAASATAQTRVAVRAARSPVGGRPRAPPPLIWAHAPETPGGRPVAVAGTRGPGRLPEGKPVGPASPTR